MDSLEEFSKIFNDAMNSIEKKSEEFWNSFSKEEQLDLFCAVSRRIYKGEIKDKGSYRYVLYNTFGFDTDAYAQAQCSEYISIHNAIYDGERLSDTVKKSIVEFCKKHLLIPEDELGAKVDNYIKEFNKKHYY